MNGYAFIGVYGSPYGVTGQSHGFSLVGALLPPSFFQLTFLILPTNSLVSRYLRQLPPTKKTKRVLCLKQQTKYNHILSFSFNVWLVSSSCSWDSTYCLVICYAEVVLSPSSSSGGSLATTRQYLFTCSQIALRTAVSLWLCAHRSGVLIP